MKFFYLSSSQKILVFSAMCAVSMQASCVYYFKKNDGFNFLYCFLYLLFSSLASIFYFKLSVTI